MSTTKIGENEPKSKTVVFRKKFALCYIKLPFTSSIYLVFLPLEMQKRPKQTNVYNTFSYFEKKRPTDL